jgi:hypothetical protein
MVTIRARTIRKAGTCLIEAALHRRQGAEPLSSFDCFIESISVHVIPILLFSSHPIIPKKIRLLSGSDFIIPFLSLQHAPCLNAIICKWRFTKATILCIITVAKRWI